MIHETREVAVYIIQAADRWKRQVAHAPLHKPRARYMVLPVYTCMCNQGLTHLLCKAAYPTPGDTT